MSIGAAIGRKPAGLQNRGEEIVACADCGQALMRFLVTKSNADLARLGEGPVVTRVQCQCELCGGESYVKTIEGAFYPGAFSDDLCFDVAESCKPDVTRFRVWSNQK